MKQFMALLRLSPVLLFALACLAAGQARAGCTNPTGNESDMTYNKDYHTMQFCNGTTWMSMSGGGPGSGPMSLISTQTASASASLQWTGLGSYNNYELVCSNILPVTNSVNFRLQFGEGAGPTWKTSNYQWTLHCLTASSGSDILCSHNASDSAIEVGGTINNAASGFSSVSFLHGLTAGNSKGLETQARTYDAGDSYFQTGGGWYSGDTNAITAIQVFMTSGNIASGTCSLYGMN